MNNPYGVNDDSPLYTQAFGLAPTAVDKDQMIRNKIKQKLETLSANKGLSLGYDTGLSPQQNLSNAVDQQLYKDTDGSYYQMKPIIGTDGNISGHEKVKYNGPTRNLYIDDTVDGNMKLGVARTDQGGFEGRYDPNTHPDWDKLPNGELAGPKGVTRKDGALMDIVLPYDTATAFEYGVHTNPAQIANRAMGTGPKTEATQQAYGAGQTEYTTQNAPMWNDDYIRTRETPLLTDNTPIPTDPKYWNPKWDKAVNNEPTDSNFIDALQSNAVKVYGKIQGGVGNVLESLGEWQQEYNRRNAPDFNDKVSKAMWESGEGWSLQAIEAGKYLQKRDDFIQANADSYYGYDGTGGKMTKDVWGNLKKGKVLEALDSVTVDGAINLVAEMVPEMTSMYNPATLLLLYSGNVADSKAEAEKNNGGKPISAARMGTILAGEVFFLAADKFAANKELGLANKVIDDAASALKNTKPAILKEAVKYAKNKVKDVAASTGTEALTEVVQEGSRILTTQAGYKDVLTEENLDVLGESAVGGAIGGGSVRATTIAPEIAKDTYQGAYKQLDKIEAKQKIEAEAKKQKAAADAKEDAEVKYEEPEVTTNLNTEEQYAANKKELATVQNNIIDLKEELVGADEEAKIGIRTQLQELEAREKSITKSIESVDNMSEVDVLNNDIAAMEEQLSVKGLAEDVKVDLETRIAKAENRIAELQTTETIDPIEAMIEKKRQAALAKGMDPKEVESKVQELRDYMTKAGISSEVLDRMVKNDISIEDVSSRIVEQGGKKDKAMEVADVTDETMSRIFKGEFTTTAMKDLAKGFKGSKLLENLTGYFKNTNKVQKELAKVYEEVGTKLQQGKGQAELEAMVKDKELATPERAMRVLAILEDTIDRGVDSEFHVQKKLGVDLKDRYVREIDVLAQLGRAYYNSYGKKLSGKDTKVNAEYADMGKKILAFGRAQGVIQDTVREIPVRNMIADEDSVVYSQGTKKMVPEADAELLVKELNTISLVDTKGDRTYAMKKVAELIKPKNFEPLRTEPTNKVESDNMSKPSKAHEVIIAEHQELRYEVKPTFLKLLQSMKAKSKEYDSIDTYFRNDPTAKAMLGVAYNNPNLMKEKDQGRNLNRADHLRNMLDNIENLSDPFYYTYESAINQRIHVMQSIMEFQGDKYMARQMVTGGEYKVDGVAKDVMIENLAEELEVSIDEVKNPTGNMLEVVKTLDESDGKVSPTMAINIAEKLGISNPFKAMSLAEAQYDVWKAGKGPVTSSYMVEGDMTASGVMNTLLNLVGNSMSADVVNKLLKSRDPYKYLNEFIQTSEDPDLKPLKEDLTKLAKIMDPTGSKDYMRTLAKYPIMTWFYGSPDTMVAKRMADEVAIDMVMSVLTKYNQEALNEINSIVDGNYVIDSTDANPNYLKDISAKDMVKLKKHYEKSIGTMYTSQMSKAFPGIVGENGYRSKMGEVYRILKETKRWNGKIRTAMGVLMEGDASLNKMSIRKLKQLAHELSDKTVIPVGVMIDNKNSFMVNLQHAADAAQLLLTLNELRKRHPELNQGIMTVHDAIYANPALMLEAKDIYEQLLAKTAVEYDFLEMAILEAEEAIAKMEDGPQKSDLMKELKLVERNDLKTKKSFIDSIKDNMSFFGSKLYRVGKRIPIDTTVTPKPKVDTVNPVEEQMKSINKAIKKNDGKGVADILAALPVSEKMENLKAKVVDALNGDIKIQNDKEWAGVSGTVYANSNGIDPRTDTTMTPDTLVEIMAHEIDHAINHAYISNNMTSPEVNYLRRVVKSMENIKATGKIGERIKYILDPFAKNTEEGKAVLRAEAIKSIGNSALETRIKQEMERLHTVHQVSELHSIMRNEPDVAEYVAKELYGKNKIWPVMERIAKKLASWISGKSKKEQRKIFSKPDESLAKTIAALEAVEMNAKAADIKEASTKAGISKKSRVEEIKGIMLTRDGRLKAEYRRMAADAGIDVKGCK